VAAVSAQGDALERTLREVCERLAPIDRTPCSPGERKAAEWIAARLRTAGIADVTLEEEPSWGGSPPTLVALGALGIAGAALVVANRRIAGALLAAGSIAGVLDEAENGPRIVRRAVRRRRTTVNVVARVENPGADRTLVVLAHHDAAQTGLLFDQTLQRKFNEWFPGLLRRVKTQPPQWWIGVAGQLGALLGAARGRRGAAATGFAITGLATCLVADVMRSPTVPGANDNLSAVGLIVAFAELLRDRPIPGLRVVLLSAGAEETLQDGIRGFMARHRHELDPDRTWMLNFDAIGSPRLIMLEGEGPFWMQEYADPSFRDLIERCAAEQGIVLERGYRARASTDSVITSRAGYPSACVCALNEWYAMSNYHLMSDTPDNLDYGTIAEATRIAYAVAHHLSVDE
jgi:Zn-dependent M28 family amino/carboxypeptidase